MLLSLAEFAGIVPKIKDPASLPAKHAQVALNCRFDQGGILPLNTDLFVVTATKNNPISLFVYYNGGSKYFFQWITDVDAVKTPLANDSFNRVFYTENGKLRVTDSTLFNQGGVDYPMASLNPSPPAPISAPIILGVATSSVLALLIIDSACTEANGTYDLIFSPGEGTGAAGTYTIISNVIISVSLNNSGSGYTYAPTVSTQVGGGKITAVMNDPTLLETRGYVSTFVNKYGEEGPPSPSSNLIPLYDGNAVSVSGLGSTTHYTMGFTHGNNFLVAGMSVKSFDLSATATIISVNITGGFLWDYTAYGTITLSAWNGVDFDLGYNLFNEYGMDIAVSSSQPIDPTTQDLTDYAIVSQRIYRINQTATGSAQYQFVVELPIAATNYTDILLDSSLGEVLPSLEWDAPPDGITGLIALPNGMLAGFVDNLLCVSVANYPHAWRVADQKPTDRPIVGLSSFGMTIIVLTEGSPYLVIGNDPANLVMEKVEGLACVSKHGIVTGDQLTLYPSTEGLSVIGPGVSKVSTTALMTLQDWTSLYSPTTIAAFFWEGKYVGFYEHSGTYAGFMFDPLNGNLVDLDFYATAGFYDSVDGTLYLVIGNNIVAFNQGTVYRTMDWISRLYRYRTNVFGCSKIMAVSYPVTADIIYPVISAAATINVSSSQPIRLPQYQSESCEIRVYGNKEVSSVHVANTFEELPE